MSPVTSNARVVLELLSAAPDGLTRRRLEEDAALSRPTIKALIEQLEAEDWVEDHVPDRPANNGGRVARVIRLGRRAGRVAGADLGHKHAHVAVADANGRILWRRDTEDIDIDAKGPAALGLVAELLAECVEKSGTEIAELRGLAVGIPAPLTLGNEIASSLFLANWTTVDVKDEMEAALENAFGREAAKHIQVFVENDANLGAYAEARMRGATCKNLIYIKVSTGIGMGLLLNGEVFRGQTGVAGEFGHVAIPAAAQRLTGLRTANLPPACPRCKKADCLENLASCDAVVAGLRASDEHYPADLDIETVIDNGLYRKREHPKCLQGLIDAGRRIGYALAEQVSVLDPDVVVIGGVLSRAGDVLAKPIRDAIGAHSTALTEVRVETLVDERKREPLESDELEQDADEHDASEAQHVQVDGGEPGAHGPADGPTANGEQPDRIRSIELDGAIALVLKETRLPNVE